jgi:hypothetical protein
MAFTFEITGISKFTKAHVGVLDGKLIEGSVTTGATAQLVHGAQHLPVRVKGVVLDSARPKNGVLSLTVDLREAAMKLASVGDRLVCA